MENGAGANLAAVVYHEERIPNDARARALLKVVERHVLPKLVMASPAVVSAPRFGNGLSERIPSLTDLALNVDDGRSRAMLRQLHRDGASFVQLQIGLLVPTARGLNALWENDDVSFLDVTLAAGSLQRMMRFVAIDLAAAPQPTLKRRSILIAPAPGEGHGFGAAMAAEFFRRDGWLVRHDAAPTEDSLAATAAATWIDVLGLSVSTDDNARALRRVVNRVRQASINPRLLVIAAGEAIARQPELVGHVGADATLAALETAPARAHRLVRALFGSDA